MISGFRRDFDEICALLRHYAEPKGNFYRRFGIKYRFHLQRPRRIEGSRRIKWAAQMARLSERTAA
jgi:hypothetical protein